MAADAQIRTDRQVIFSRYLFAQWVSLQKPYLSQLAPALRSDQFDLGCFSHLVLLGWFG